MTETRYGPWPGEGPAPRLGPVDRVAVLSDVHGNVPALTAVLAEAVSDAPDLYVFCGDLTWGAEPERTLDIVAALGERVGFVRGNAERAVVDLARGRRPAERERERWMVAQHSPEAVATLAGFPFSLVVEVAGLGPVRFCHGSPRSDTELVTQGTAAERVAALAAGIEERVLVTGHTHLQFDREVAGIRSVNPGSVGLPYHEGEPGTAYWALLGPDVALRRTRYDLAEAIAAGNRVADPAAARTAELLTTPPAIAEVIAHTEERVMSD